MARYKSCPTCGNSESGTEIWKCKECGHIGCYKQVFLFSDGCMSDSFSECPRCGNTGGVFSVWHSVLGRIEDDD